MNDLLNILQECSVNFKIPSLAENIERIQKFIGSKNIIDIVILGQFKAGKSSFLNHFIGQEILPTGVTPVTSLVTRLQYGVTEKAIVTFINGSSKEIPLSMIDEFIAENKNPENQKQAYIVDIELPMLNQFRGIRFVDTPGIGSVFHHNTETTENWYTEIGIAFITISAERPLGKNEMTLISEVSNHTPEIMILLTKVDLFNNDQLAEIRDYIGNQLQKEFKFKFRIYSYSINDSNSTYKKRITNEAINPVLSGFKHAHEKIATHKINFLAESCLNFLNIAYETSLRSDAEKEQLKKRIFDEKLNTSFIQQELRLITESSRSQTREKIFEILEKYNAGLISELKTLFISEYSKWRGNLYKVSRKYETWMKTVLSSRLKEIAETEQPQIAAISKRIDDHFSFYTNTLSAKLSDNIYKVIGIKLSDEEWKPEFKPLKKPDISVYRAFDSNIDLLWFLIPMFLFRKLFRRYFSRQISFEVEKNLHRLTSDLTEIINKQTEQNKIQTLKYITTELSTIEKALSGEQSKSSTYKESSDIIQKKVSESEY